ncbi:MAG: hypothetical protein WC254_05365 [Candidatus Woesearchaeota archaeon]|jgi:hypothetical protein
MKQTIIFLVLFILLTSGVFAISSTSSDSSVSDISATGAAAAKASSSDSSVTSTVSAGASAVASAYASSDGTISGKSGFPVTTATSTPASTPTSTPTTTTESSSIPSGGGGGPSGTTTESTTESAAETTESAATTTETAESAAETTESADLVGQVLLAPLEVTTVMEAGQSLALSSSLMEGDASPYFFVQDVTETTATIEINTDNPAAELITGNVVAEIGESIVLTPGEFVELDTNNDGQIEIKIVLTEIILEEGEYKASFNILYYVNDQITRNLIQQQIESGEVSRPTQKTWLGVGVIIGIIVLFAITLIMRVIQAKKKRPYLFK